MAGTIEKIHFERFASPRKLLAAYSDCLLAPNLSAFVEGC